MSETEKLMQLLREKLGPLADILWAQAMRSARVSGIVCTVIGGVFLLAVVIGWIVHGIRNADGKDHSDLTMGMILATAILGLIGVFLLPMGIWQLTHLELSAFQSLF